MPAHGPGGADPGPSPPIVGARIEGGPALYIRPRMLPFVESLVRQATLTTLLDIAITALFIYWLFSLIRGTLAVTLVIGVSILLGVYALAQWLQRRRFMRRFSGGRGRRAVRARRRVPARAPARPRAHRARRDVRLAPRRPAQRAIEHIAAEVARAAGVLSREGHGALIVLERDTGSRRSPRPA